MRRPPGPGGRAPSLLSLWAPVVAFMALIFAVSAMSAPPAPSNVGDKTLQFLAYGVLAALSLRATSGGRLAGLSAPSALAAWLVAVCYGVTDEFHQRFVPGRSPDPADVMADAAGAALAVVVLGAFGIIARSRGTARPR